QKTAQKLQHLRIIKAPGSLLDDMPRPLEQVTRHDPGERAVAAYPLIRRVPGPPLLQLEGDAVVDVIADVLLVGQHLMHGSPGPEPSEVGEDAIAVQGIGYGPLVGVRFDKGTVYALHDLQFCWRAGHQDDPVSLDALVLAEFQPDKAALPDEHLRGQLTTVFARHRPLDTFYDGRDRGAVVVELLGAINDADSGLGTEVFVMRALVGVLEPSPAADVIDEYGLIFSTAALDVLDQAAQGIASAYVETALPLVGVGAHDRHAMCLGIASDDGGLVFGGIALVIGGHADVLRHRDRNRPLATPDRVSLTWIQLDSPVKLLPTSPSFK